MKFDPEDISIRKGDTVKWVNLDIVDHDVAALDATSWSSTPIKETKSWRKVFDQGWEYKCALHPVMHGRISVADSGPIQ